MKLVFLGNKKSSWNARTLLRYLKVLQENKKDFSSDKFKENSKFNTLKASGQFLLYTKWAFHFRCHNFFLLAEYSLKFPEAVLARFFLLNLTCSNRQWSVENFQYFRNLLARRTNSLQDISSNYSGISIRMQRIYITCHLNLAYTTFFVPISSNQCRLDKPETTISHNISVQNH